jgi:hypothetical protein
MGRVDYQPRGGGVTAPRKARAARRPGTASAQRDHA